MRRRLQRFTVTQRRSTRAQVIRGLADIGIRLDRDINGGPAIGRGRLTRARAGMPRATTNIGTIPATGGANAS